MPKLFILRHGESSPGSPDFDRPLREQGRLDIERFGIKLAELEPELASNKIILLSSPSKRTQRNDSIATLRTSQPGYFSKLHRRWIPRRSRDLDQEHRKAPSETPTCIVVGHNPGISDLITILSGSHITMTPGACVSDGSYLSTIGMKYLKAQGTF